ncbi:MAG: hypothetical protein KDB53_08300 [Planctomycetes bacterium]|nr:hypothetical protein [Planctomycetota bacterium]
MMRSLTMICLVGALALGAMSCRDGDAQSVSSARNLAVQFHDAIQAADFDAERILPLVDYPFLLDEVTVQDERELMAALIKSKGAIRHAVSSARTMEVCSYEEFLDGKPVAGRSLDKDEAKRQARKIELRPGGILVRCYSDLKNDSRNYFLVMHPNRLGDLKITTFWD